MTAVFVIGAGMPNPSIERTCNGRRSPQTLDSMATSMSRAPLQGSRKHASLAGSRRWVVVLFALVGPFLGALPFCALFFLDGKNGSVALAPLVFSYLIAGFGPLLAAIIFIRLVHSGVLGFGGSTPARFALLGAVAGTLGACVWCTVLLALGGDSSAKFAGLSLAIVVLGMLCETLCGAVASRFVASNAA